MALRTLFCAALEAPSLRNPPDFVCLSRYSQEDQRLLLKSICKEEEERGKELKISRPIGVCFYWQRGFPFSSFAGTFHAPCSPTPRAAWQRRLRGENQMFPELSLLIKCLHGDLCLFFEDPDLFQVLRQG